MKGSAVIVITRRRLLIAFGAGALAAPLASFAQQPAKIFRIGFLGSESASSWASRVEALRAGLRDLGYVEGKNIVIEFRWAEGKNDRLPDLAAQLVRLKVDVLLTHGTPPTLAAKQSTATIPIVMTGVGDAVAVGIVASLARPGGNITGTTYFAPELGAKRIELLKEALPRITRVAVLSNPDNSSNALFFQAMEVTAKAVKVGLQQFEARGPNVFDSAFAAMAKKRVGAVVVQEDPMLNVNQGAIANLAVKHRLASAGIIELAEAGGLIGYGVVYLEMYRRAAYFIDKILKGTKPGDIPVERPTKFEMVINMKTAKALGIKLPNAILLRPDRVIE